MLTTCTVSPLYNAPGSLSELIYFINDDSILCVEPQLIIPGKGLIAYCFQMLVQRGLV